MGIDIIPVSEVQVPGEDTPEKLLPGANIFF